MRRVPPRLHEHLQQSVTTTCRLLLFMLADGTQIGATTLDRDVHYMGVTYNAMSGFDPSIIATDIGLSVDNAEAEGLLSATLQGVTAGMIERGAMDNAKWRMMLVNWADLSMGHVILDGGDVGEVTIKNGVAHITELLSFAMRLRQPIGGSWSRLCRAEFGTDANSQTGCGVNADDLWVEMSVVAVDDEDGFRVFRAEALSAYATHVFPARLKWISGDNTGPRLWQVEAASKSAQTIALFEAMPSQIEIGDRFMFRADCNKSPSHCTAYGNFINYKGEPYIPTGDGLESMTPSAQTFGGVSGSEITG